MEKGSCDRPPFVVATDKKILTKDSSKSFTPKKFRDDDKCRLSYSDFHIEITKKVEDICSNRLEDRLKSRIGRTASGERDLAKYKSYVPSYIKKCDKLEVKDVKAGGTGSHDLRNRQSGDKQMDKHTRFSSLSNSSTSSSLWTDESPTDSSRRLCDSPFRKRINHPPLQYYLTSSKPGDDFQDLEPPGDSGDTSQSRSFLSANSTDKQRDRQVHQSPCAAVFQQNEKKDTDCKIVPKTRTFLSPSKPDSPCTRIISRNLAEDFMKKGEKLEERIRNPRVHDLFGKDKPAAVFVPGIVSQKQLVGLSRFYDSKVLLAERVAEFNRKGFPEKLSYGKGAVLDSDICPFRRDADRSKPLLKRMNFLSAERSCSAPRSRKSESSPSKSRTLDRRSAETFPKQQDQQPAKVTSERARSISPFRRLSFSIGKFSKNSKAEDARPPSHLNTSLISSRAGSDNPSTSSFSVSSFFDKSSAVNRSRSSPLRRLFDPLIKPKSSHSCRSPEPSQKDSPSSHQKHILSDSQPSPSSLLSRNEKTSTVQALFRVTSKNDQPLFTFAVEKEQSITAATIRKQTPPENEDCGYKYTFFSVEEVEKKNGKWMNHGRTVQSQEYTSNIVAQMRVSGSKSMNPTGETSADNLLTKEFVLLASESQRSNELAAMVIKFPKIAGPSSTKDTTFRDYFGNVNATVVLPSGIHSLPHKGGPSSLIQRWKSGGSCDCGGWDMGCNLRILTNQNNKPRNLSPSASDALKLFFQGGLKDNNNSNEPFLSFSPYREGVYAAEYNTSLSLLQAFSICIAVTEGRNPSKTTEPNISNVLKKGYGEMSPIQNERLKSFEAEAPARNMSHHPPLSPVGRV